MADIFDRLAQSQTQPEPDLFDRLKSAMTPAPGGLGADLVNAAGQIGTSLGNTAKGVWGGISGLYNEGFKPTGEIGKDFEQAVANGFKGTLQNFKNSIDQARAAQKQGHTGLLESAYGAPILGPMLQDFVQKESTPGRRIEGLTDAAQLLYGPKILKGAAGSIGKIAANTAEGVANANRAAPYLPAIQKMADAANLPKNNPFVNEILARSGAAMNDANDVNRVVDLGIEPQPQNGTASAIDYDKKVVSGPPGRMPWHESAIKRLWGYIPDNIVQQDLAGNLDAALDKANAIEEAHYLDPLRKAGVTRSAQPVLDAVKAAPTDYAKRANPGDFNSALGRLNNIYSEPVMGPNGPVLDASGNPTYRARQMSADQLKLADQGINNELQAVLQNKPGVLRAELGKDPYTASLMAEGKAVRDLMYGLDPTGQWRDINLTKAALMDMKDALQQMQAGSIAADTGPSAARAMPFGLRSAAQYLMGETRGAASNASQAINRLLGEKGNALKFARGLEDLDVQHPQWQAPQGNFWGAATSNPSPGYPIGSPNWREAKGGPLAPTSPGTGWTSGPPNPSIHISGYTQGLPGSQIPPMGLPPAVMSPRRQIGASTLGSGPTIPLPGEQGGIPMPPAPDTSGPIPGRQGPAMPIIDPVTGEVTGYSSSQAATPQQPWQVAPPSDVPPAAKGMIVLPKPPGMPQMPGPVRPPVAPKPPASAAARDKVLNTFRGHKQRLDRQFVGMAKKNKIGAYGVPPGVLTDAQQGQYNAAINTLNQQQQADLALIPPETPQPAPRPQPAPLPAPLPAAAGTPPLVGPTDAVVGEAGPERIDHADGRPPDIVSGAQRITLGTHGADKVTPLTPFPKGGIIRGSSDIPLNERGRHEAQALGHAIAAHGGIDKIYSSDLARTKESAQLVGAPSNAQIMPPTPMLRSWAMGTLEGQPVSKETDAIVDHHIHAAPDQPLPGMGPASTQPGESFDQFKDRAISALQAAFQEWLQNPQSRIGLVTHNRDEKVFKGWIKSGARPDKMIDKRELQEKGNPPGGMIHITAGPDGKPQVEDHDLAKKGMPPGLYGLRHFSTDWNAQNQEPGS